MKILVTGGAGYIGSVVVATLLQGGHEVVVLDNLSKGHRSAVAPEARFVQADVGDAQALTGVMRDAGFDGVMHFAASIEAGESMQVPERFFRNNTVNAFVLLEQMLQHGIPRFVFSSTAALYGNPARTPIDEDDALQPTNAYGASKLLVEQTLPWYHRIHGLKYACLRYFNASGATETLGEDHHPETHLVPVVLQAARGERPSVSIHGADYPTVDGSCVRDYIHVSDLASAHLLALENLGKSQQHEALVYNLGNGKGFSVKQVIAAASEVTGKEVQIVEGPRRAGDPAVLVASSDRIRRDLGWRPQHSDLRTILESAWRWRESHPNGYGQGRS